MQHIINPQRADPHDVLKCAIGIFPIAVLTPGLITDVDNKRLNALSSAAKISKHSIRQLLSDVSNRAFATTGPKWVCDGETYALTVTLHNSNAVF